MQDRGLERAEQSIYVYEEDPGTASTRRRRIPAAIAVTSEGSGRAVYPLTRAEALQAFNEMDRRDMSQPSRVSLEFAERCVYRTDEEEDRLIARIDETSKDRKARTRSAKPALVVDPDPEDDELAYVSDQCSDEEIAARLRARWVRIRARQNN